MRNKNHFMSLTTKLFTLHKTYSTNTKILGLENKYITSKINVTELKTNFKKRITKRDFKFEWKRFKKLDRRRSTMRTKE